MNWSYGVVLLLMIVSYDFTRSTSRSELTFKESRVLPYIPTGLRRLSPRQMHGAFNNIHPSPDLHSPTSYIDNSLPVEHLSICSSFLALDPISFGLGAFDRSRARGAKRTGTLGLCFLPFRKCHQDLRALPLHEASFHGHTLRVSFRCSEP